MNKLGKKYHFYLCKVEGNSRSLIKKLEIPVDFEKNHIAATTCSIAGGKFGNEYFAVVDNDSAQVIRAYHFDSKKEDIESVKSQDMVCSDSSE